MDELDWNVLDTGVHSAEENMRLDKELLDTLDPHSSPILHFYEWEGDSATYGYFVNPADFLNLEVAAEKGLSLARRPTGGGIVFHLWDLAFSVLVPAGHPHFSENTLDNYAYVNNTVLSAVADFLEERPKLDLISQDATALDASSTRFCMARPTKYDVVFQGKKIAGAAQRKTKQGFLHQGTISLKFPSRQYLEEILLPSTKVLEAIEANTFPLLTEEEDLEKGRSELKTHLETHFKSAHDYVTKH